MQFSLKPVFVGWVALLSQLPFQLFLSVWCGGFGGSILAMTGLFPRHSGMPFLLSGGLAFVLVPAAVYIGRKYNYRRTEYRFLEDHMEFEEGFLTINKKTLKYRDVREVTLRRGVLQRLCGLGTVYLATLATGTAAYANPLSLLGFGNISASGIRVRDVADPEDAYAKIRAIVASHN
jgi:membrane protein YdbS with pleckstrin-like domain